ncbi:hypothetical protein BG011_004497 [Mortierella polycephala]|uniref:Uncharacterized protein n=1 Tax=Mortierella polycephala TaxID=41804 RepID=A0A9P6PZJ9_9FUNG|nr:hypothetical protein BG011_004497 [Mortierella polycephala]
MSTPPTASLPQAQLWETFRSDPSAADLYLPDTHIVFLPTGAGAATEKYVREFYHTGGFSHPKKLSVEEETVIHRTVGESSAVDEVAITVKFVSGAGGWLLPGVQPHHLEDLVITFPMVICASFAEGRIASVRYVWDNASVLKMARLIGSRQSWPIVADTQVDALRSPSRFRLNPFGNAISTAGSRPQIGISQIFGATPPISPTLNTAQAEQLAKKGHPALTSTLFNHLKEQPQQTPSDDKKPVANQWQQSVPEEERGAGWRADYVKSKGHPALTSTIFSQQPYTPSPTVTRPYKKTSHNIFGAPIETPKPKEIPTPAAEVFNQQEEPQSQGQEQSYTLEPSAIDEKLERDNQQQEELKEALVKSEHAQDLQKEIDAFEKLVIQQEEKREEQEQPAPLSPVSPISAQSPVRRTHPNYRTSFTIGGPSIN